MSSKRRTKARGFTLIELLVVIAIIAILAAILFPVLTNARRQGRVSSCQSNIRQIAVSVFMYADDNQGQMMPYDINHGDRPVKKMWFELLSPYMKAGKVYCCSELLNSKSTDTTTGKDVYKRQGKYLTSNTKVFFVLRYNGYNWAGGRHLIPYTSALRCPTA